MRILLLCHAFNSLTQRVHIELRQRGHQVSVEFDINDETTADAVAKFQPRLIVAPYLKRAIPEAVWRDYPCLVLHPGPLGDRGPAALDWAVLQELESWGVTVLQADGEFDAGAVWAHAEFPLRRASKSSLYRHEITRHGTAAIIDAVKRLERGLPPLEPLED